MSRVTAIEWCDHTFNPWIGCTKVSSACDHCYAETMAMRYGWAKWGPGQPRRRTTDRNWHLPLARDREAGKARVRRRVFCASLADVFDAEVPDDWRDELFASVVMATPNLDWLLLTKRPQVARKWFDEHPAPDNVMLGATVEDQKMADLRAPILNDTKVRRRFLSMEPLLGPVDVLPYLFISTHADSARLADEHDDVETNPLPFRDPATTPAENICTPRIDWVITGGESGRGARPSHPDWFRSLRDQCSAADVPFFFKQWGEFAPAFGSDLKPYPGKPWKGEDQRAVAEGRATLQQATVHVGKKRAGATLDGRLHREFPT